MKPQSVMIDGVPFVPVPDLPADRVARAALDVRFDSDAGDNLSVREYLHALLKGVWEEGEGFDGKRPFGNSGWEYELYRPLIKNGFIGGTLDENGYVEELADKGAAEGYVRALIDSMCGVASK